MTQSEGSTAPNFNMPEWHDGTVTVGPVTQPVLNVEEAVRVALVPPVDAPTEDVGINGDETTTLPNSNHDRNGSGVSRLLSFPFPPELPQRATLHAIQEWEGHVVEVNDNAFVAHLVDLTTGAAYAEEEATIPMAEISDEDAARMSNGSIFRWVIGYKHLPSGTKERVSRIVFRDLPRMTEADFEEGKEWARKITKSLDL